MKKIGILIPEFPGQTHAFFMREMAEINRLGVSTEIISTQKPVAGAGLANHDWALGAQKLTVYLFPIKTMLLIRCIVEILISGVSSWINIAKAISRAEIATSEKVKHLGFVLIAAHLKIITRKKGLQHVHVHSCANSANIALYCKCLGGPSYSLTLHGPLQDYGSNQKEKWGGASFGLIITQELMQEIRSEIPAENLPELFLAPMGVNVKNFVRTQPYELPDKDKQIKIVSCGRLNPIKGHDDLIKAVDTLVNQKNLDVVLSICGATDSISDRIGYLDELKKLVEAKGLTGRIEFLGSVSEDVVKQKLEESHFFCLASHKEPLGVAIMEAMAMETPALVTRSPGTVEMITDGVDGYLLEPKSPNDFSDKIYSLVVNPSGLDELRQKGRVTVEKRFHSGISAEVIAKMATK